MPNCAEQTRSETGSTSLDSNSRRWSLEFAHGFTVATWDVAAEGGQQDVNVTRADLDGALTIRVESLQGTFDATDNPWKASASDSVAAAGGS